MIIFGAQVILDAINVNLGDGPCQISSASSMSNVPRAWITNAVTLLADEARSAASTALIRLSLPELSGVDLYLKDETSHMTGSLKHRLARSLFLHGICNGDIGPHTTVVEASSGSTAISEAWFAKLLGLAFVAVVPRSTAIAKVAAIRAVGGQIHLAEGNEDCCALAASIAAERGGHFMDQFTHAERVIDWRGNNNVAQSMFEQMETEPHPVPSWIVVGAGTGGTSATIGRYIRLNTRYSTSGLCVVDPVGSAFYKSYLSGNQQVTGCTSRVVEGIGRPRVEPSFKPKLIDRMLSVPDRASIAGARWIADRYGHSFGPSTGTNMAGALTLACEMRARSETGSVVTFACDRGDRYHATIYDDRWVAEHEPEGLQWRAWVRELLHNGTRL